MLLKIDALNGFRKRFWVNLKAGSAWGDGDTYDPCSGDLVYWQAQSCNTGECVWMRFDGWTPKKQIKSLPCASPTNTKPRFTACQFTSVTNYQACKTAGTCCDNTCNN